jgi:NADH-quinone oxidoreductase subunit J
VTAAIYIMLQLEFVALAQIMIYIGGIIIFMMIIILLTTGLGVENRLQVPNSSRLAGGAVSATLLFGLLYAISGKQSAILIKSVQRAAPVTIDDIGLRFLATGKDGFIVPFEIISILLLVALVGAVVIARRDNSVTNSHGDGKEESA